MGAPQYIWLGLSILALLIGIAKDGQPREPHKMDTSVAAFVFSNWLLWWGGFFS